MLIRPDGPVPATRSTSTTTATPRRSGSKLRSRSGELSKTSPLLSFRQARIYNRPG